MPNDNDQQPFLMPELAKRIKSARISAHLSQLNIAKTIGVSDKSISAYEQGRSTPPFEKLKRLALATGHTLAYFIDDNNEDASISSKLAAIERELIEIKELFSKIKKNT